MEWAFLAQNHYAGGTDSRFGTTTADKDGGFWRNKSSIGLHKAQMKPIGCVLDLNRTIKQKEETCCFNANVLTLFILS